MRKARFLDPTGRIRIGEPVEEGIVASGRVYAFEEITILPPSEPTKIICVGINYYDHIEEGTFDDAPDIPMFFLKPPNCVSRHGAAIDLPSVAEWYEPEAEIAAVIGEQCHNVDRGDAMDYVSGFTCGNDLSNRDDQYMEMERRWSYVRGKAFDNASPLGPYLADPRDVPSDATLELRVNGETRQKSSRDRMIFSVSELVEEISAYMTLERGDVILTGTPAGVEPLYDGDEIAVELEGVGTLRNTVHIADSGRMELYT